jgi:hypothetical protein
MTLSRPVGIFLSVLFLSVLLLAGCASLPVDGGDRPAEKGTVLVRLVDGDEALPGAKAYAFRDLGVQFQEDRFGAVADRMGNATLSLVPGTYFFTALSADGGLFGYYGPNPVQVRGGERQAVTIRGLAGNRPPATHSAGDGPGGVEGVVVTADGPLAGAVVALYLDASNHFRGPAYVEVETDGEGRFDTTLSPGRYFLVVRKRSEPGGGFGPLQIGDSFGYYGRNPLFLRDGERVSVQVSALRVQKRSGWSKPSTLRTRLRGVVRNRRGEPLAGYRALLHRQPDMLGKPDAVSEESGPDGRFELWAEREGAFILGARRVIGRARTEGEVIGYYEGTADHTIAVTMDGREMTGLDIIVDEGEGDEEE